VLKIANKITENCRRFISQQAKLIQRYREMVQNREANSESAYAWSVCSSTD